MPWKERPGIHVMLHKGVADDHIPNLQTLGESA